MNASFLLRLYYTCKQNDIHFSNSKTENCRIEICGHPIIKRYINVSYFKTDITKSLHKRKGNKKKKIVGINRKVLRRCEYRKDMSQPHQVYQLSNEKRSTFYFLHIKGPSTQG